LRAFLFLCETFFLHFISSSLLCVNERCFAQKLFTFPHPRRVHTSTHTPPIASKTFSQSSKVMKLQTHTCQKGKSPLILQKLLIFRTVLLYLFLLLSLSILTSWLLIIQVLVAMNSLIGLTSYEFKETPDTETTVLSVWFFCFFISTR